MVGLSCIHGDLHGRGFRTTQFSNKVNMNKKFELEYILLSFFFLIHRITEQTMPNFARGASKQIMITLNGWTVQLQVCKGIIVGDGND